MESNSEASCISDPNFAVICAFLERFATSCGITYPPFVDLQEMLENIDQVPQELIDLHIILLRKARRSVFREKWEKALVKFCQSYSVQDGWEIERFGYKNSRLEVKLRVLKTLLEGQFDLNCKFKTTINTLESNELRSKPIGKDKNGRIYWLQVDSTSNIRLYREDLDEDSWTLVAKDRDSFVNLLQELSVDEQPVDINLINEDSSVSVEIEKPILDTGQENGVSDNDNVTTIGETGEEKDPLEIKDSDNISEVNHEESEDIVFNDDLKRLNDDIDEERDIKKIKLDDGTNGVDIGEAIEDPIMHIIGEGNGAECDAGNPENDENKPAESSSSNVSEQSEPVNSNQSQAELKKVDSEVKPQPKLWSIDTICGTGSFNHSGESSRNFKSCQKNFSSFSIESVLEKKSDFSNSPSSSVSESPVISVNAVGITDTQVSPNVSKINQINDQDVADSNISSHSVDIESPMCNASNEIIKNTVEGKDENISGIVNENDPVPNDRKDESKELSSVSAENDIAAVENRECNYLEHASSGRIGEGDFGEKNDVGLISHDGEKLTQKTESINISVEKNSIANDSVILQHSHKDLPSTCSIDLEHVRDMKDEIVSDKSEISETLINDDFKKEMEDNKDGIIEKEIDVDSLRLNNKVSVSQATIHDDDLMAPKNHEDTTENVSYFDEVEKESMESNKVNEETSNVESETTETNETVEDKHPLVTLPLKEINNVTEVVCDGKIPNQEIIAEEPTIPNLEIKLEPHILPSNDDVRKIELDSDEQKPECMFELQNQKEVHLTHELSDVQTKVEDPSSEPMPFNVNLTGETREVMTEFNALGTEKNESQNEFKENIEETQADVKQEKFEHLLQESNIEINVKQTEDERSIENETGDVNSKETNSEKTLQKLDEGGLILKDENNIQMRSDVEEVKKLNDDPEEDIKSKYEEASSPTETHKEENTKSEEVLEPSNEENCKLQSEEQVDKGLCSEVSHGEKENSLEPRDLPITDEVDGTQKEDNEKKTQSEKPGRKRKLGKSRNLQIPARATRSSKKSVDEDVDAPKELPPSTRKRKSQDSNENSEICGLSAKPDETEAEQKKPPERRRSVVNSVSEENSAATQEESSEVGGKRVKMRNKKKLDAKIRKNVEEKRNQQDNSSDDEKKPVEEGEETINDEEKKKTQKTKAKDGTPRSRQLIPERELKLLGISNMEELPTIRQSRRIAQLKLKEEAERNRLKKLEEAAKEEEEKQKRKKKKKKKAFKSGSKKRKATGEESYEEEEDDDEDEGKVNQEKEKKRKKKKDKLKFNELNPWISSSGSSSADEEDEDIEDEPHEEEELLFKSDHEFSPESDVEDPDYKPVKRARTAKVDPKDATEADSKYDDTACEKCGEKDHPEWILLCDTCDKGWHASCVRPALMVVPEGDWFCPPCEHTSLVAKLRESLVEYDKTQKQRENEELRRKRLAFVGISLDNVLPAKKDKKPKVVEENEGESDETATGDGSNEDSNSSSSSSSGSSSSDESSEPVYQLRERRSNVTSYRYNEYDELIKSALQEEMEAAKGLGLGKGKDIRNQAEYGGAEGYEESKENNEACSQYIAEELNHQNELNAINPQLPKDIRVAKPRIKSKKKGEDDDYEAETDGEGNETYNGGDDEEEEEEEELADEVPPVVPRHDKKKKKSRSLNVKGLDFTSDEEEEDNSDSDFKGESSEEESDYSMPSESESSDGVRRKPKNFDGPLRRSTRARTARYDREFINDDSDDDTNRRKKARSVWVESESSDSDRSWGRRRKKGGRSRSSVPRRKSKPKGKKKKNKKRIVDSENEDGEKPMPKKPRNRKIKYGLEDLDEEQVLTRRTRGKKINYQEMNASESDDEVIRRRPRVIGESDEEFVADKDKSDESEENDGVLKREKKGKAISKKLIIRKMKKRRKVIPDPDDFSEEDILEDEELEQFAQELENLDEEEGDILDKMLNDGDVPIHELKDALKKVKERRKNKIELGQSYTPMPELMENVGGTLRLPKIKKMKIMPTLNVPQQSVMGMRLSAGQSIVPKDGELPETDQQGNIILLNEPKTDSKEALMNIQPPPYPFPAEGSPGIAAPSMVNPIGHPFPINNRPPIPPYSSFQGMIPPPSRMPPEYPHANIPTTVLGIENDALQDVRNQTRKSGTKNKRRNEDSLSPQAESGEENSGDGRISDNVDSPSKRRGRGRGKKQLLAEAQAKQEMGVATVQAPTHFPPQGLASESGSVITRMLNTPQGPQPFPPEYVMGGRPRVPYRPPFPNTLRPPVNPPSPSRLRAPTPALFHTSHPLDPSSSSINLPQGKPSQLPPGFPPRPPLPPRYSSDPNIRPPFPTPSSPPRNENFPYPNFYGPYPPPPIPNSEEAPFHNPNYPNHPFDEQHQPSPIDGTGKPTYEEEAGGEFGGLASYFASQREEDLDT